MQEHFLATLSRTPGSYIAVWLFLFCPHLAEKLGEKKKLWCVVVEPPLLP